MSKKSEKKMPMRRNPAGQSDFQTTRSCENAHLRAMSEEADEKRFELSFSSEDPVRRWYGQEILDHSDGCMDLSRLQELGVVLFNHDPNKVVGKVVRAGIISGRGTAEIEFDDDEEAEIIRKKVQSGTLKGVSVGYSVDEWEAVEPNKKSKDGRFTGPCYIATRWTPLEISIVSVPADATVGVGRSVENTPPDMLAVYERTVQANENMLRLFSEQR